jgi:hypothetical protein
LAEPTTRTRAGCRPAKRRREAVLPLLPICVLAVAATSCKDDNLRTPSEDREPVRIALIGEARDDPTWPVLQATATWFTNRHRRAEVDTDAPRTISPGEQRKLLADLATKPYDAVCVVPSDPDAVRASIQDLVRHGKRVMTLGRDVSKSDRHACFGPSNTETGRTAAQACAVVLRGRAPTIMLLYGGVENDTYAARYYAFKNELPLLEGLQVLREVDCAGKELDAAHLVRVEARRYPRAGCWVFLEDWPLKSVSDHERLLPLGGGIVLCDGSPRHWARLRDGQILALITYDFRLAVEEALLAASRRPTNQKEARYTSLNLPPEIVTVRELESCERRWQLWAQPDQSAESAGKQTAPPQEPLAAEPDLSPRRATSSRSEEKSPQSP